MSKSTRTTQILITVHHYDTVTPEFVAGQIGHRAYTMDCIAVEAGKACHGQAAIEPVKVEVLTSVPGWPFGTPVPTKTIGLPDETDAFRTAAEAASKFRHIEGALWDDKTVTLGGKVYQRPGLQINLPEGSEGTIVQSSDEMVTTYSSKPRRAGPGVDPMGSDAEPTSDVPAMKPAFAQSSKKPLMQAVVELCLNYSADELKQFQQQLLQIAAEKSPPL